jgi:hypothetical protein
MRKPDPDKNSIARISEDTEGHIDAACAVMRRANRLIARFDTLEDAEEACGALSDACAFLLRIVQIQQARIVNIEKGGCERT